MTEVSTEYDVEAALPENFVDLYKDACRLCSVRSTNEEYCKGSDLRNELLEKLEDRITYISNTIVEISKQRLDLHYDFMDIYNDFYKGFYNELYENSDCVEIKGLDGPVELQPSWIYNKNFKDELLSMLSLTKDKVYKIAANSLEDDEYSFIESLIHVHAKAGKFSLITEDLFPTTISKLESNGFVVKELTEIYTISWE